MPTEDASTPTEQPSFWPEYYQALAPWPAADLVNASLVLPFISPPAFETEHFEEREYDGTTALGDPKHWHMFEVVARRP